MIDLTGRRYRSSFAFATEMKDRPAHSVFQFVYFPLLLLVFLLSLFPSFSTRLDRQQVLQIYHQYRTRRSYQLHKTKKKNKSTSKKRKGKDDLCKILRICLKRLSFLSTTQSARNHLFTVLFLHLICFLLFNFR